MKTLILLLTILFFFNQLIMGQSEMDNNIRKKLENAVKNTFQTEIFSLFPENDSVMTGLNYEKGWTEDTYRIENNGSLLGFARLSSAMGRYEKFDFLVLFSPGWIIEQVEILVYRSDHGFEIMNKRWLSQFKGSNGCGLVYGKDIDAISGATISGNSLTDAISKMCEELELSKITQQNNY